MNPPDFFLFFRWRCSWSSTACFHFTPTGASAAVCTLGSSGTDWSRLVHAGRPPWSHWHATAPRSRWQSCPESYVKNTKRMAQRFLKHDCLSCRQTKRAWKTRCCWSHHANCSFYKSVSNRKWHIQWRHKHDLQHVTYIELQHISIASWIRVDWRINSNIFFKTPSFTSIKIEKHDYRFSNN